ncbi:MAG TPA: toprim domain-containing protein, partial [Polyangiaceae bacterium]|nr:toprim domain-containing protein [Polyangiaceae bacterium]
DRRKKDREALYEAMQIAATWYEQQLREHPLRRYAIDELARRDLEPTSDVVQLFRLGFAPPGWDGLASFLQKQGVSPAVAEAVGLLAPRAGGGAAPGAARESRGYYDRFRHRLMFAVIDAQGRVVAFSGRALAPVDDADAGRDPPPKYVNSPESPIYVKGSTLFGLWQARHSIRQKEQALLVEGNFDVVSLHARGVDNVVAPLGTAFTADQARLLHRYAVKLTLLFDADAAGRKAARAAEEPCQEAGLDAKVAALPDRTDPDEFVRQKGPDALRHVVGQARGLVEYLIDAELDESFNAADSHECAARVDRVVAIIGRQRDPVERAMAEAYADRAAGRLDLVRSAPNAWGALKRKFLAMRRAARVPTGPRPWQARIQPRRGDDARRPGHDERKAIVGALLDFPVLLDDSELRGAFELMEGESARIVAAIRASMRTNALGQKILDTTEFLAQMPPVIQAFASARLAAPVHDSVEEARATVSVNAKKLLESHVARETSEIVREQHRLAGDWDTEVELMKHADALVRQQHGFVGTRVEGVRTDDRAGAHTRVGQKHRGNDGDEES